MSDPVILAAQRAWDGEDPLGGVPYMPGDQGIWTPEAMEAAASEALRPIRERHTHWVAELEKSPLPATAGAIALVVLADLAPLIFTTEELER